MTIKNLPIKTLSILTLVTTFSTYGSDLNTSNLSKNKIDAKQNSQVSENKVFIENQEILNLDQLLESTHRLKLNEKKRYQAREDNFMANRDKQKSLVSNAKQDFLQAQKIANPLVIVTDKQQKKIDELQTKLDKHSEELGDIHSIYSQFSGDFIARMKDSLVQSQLPKRQEVLQTLQSTTELASIQDMREMWLLVMQEMTEAGKNIQYRSEVINSQGKSQVQDVIRLGTFSLFSEGRFLRFIPENQELLVIDQQPIEQGVMQEFSEAVSELKSNDHNGLSNHLASAVIDPSRGDLLAILGQSPSIYERLLQGKEVGFSIVILGVVGLLLIFYRLVYLSVTWVKTQQQLKNLSDIKTDNPLGRIFTKVNQLDGASKRDDESLQLALDEAILKELPRLEQGHSLIKLFSAIAPLLGLLGTVIGMIATFQSISLFGSGDAKLMAGGISQALVTTVLGLTVAIPLLLSHNLLVSFSKMLLQILDEQSAGILAKDRESERVILQD
jgi:biopolymer transport protein ExbB